MQGGGVQLAVMNTLNIMDCYIHSLLRVDLFIFELLERF